MGNKKTPNLPTVKDPQLQEVRVRDLDGLGEAIHQSTKGEEGSRNRIPFFRAGGWAKIFWKWERHFSRRDRVTERMRTPQHERNLEVCAANALNRSIAPYIIFRYPFPLRIFPASLNIYNIQLS